jgi:putative ABC transport system permease protein
MMQTFWQDVRYGIRILLKNPGFTTVALVTLALGIGANSAIFTVVNTVLLRPLAYRDPSRLVMVWEKSRPRQDVTGRPHAFDQNVISPANFMDWHDQATVFDQMAAFVDFRENLTGNGDPEEIPVQAAQENIFSLLGAEALLGRVFTPENGQEGHDNVVILSYGLWQRRFGGARDVIGKTVTLSGQQAEVIGVMPPGFQLLIRQGSMVGEPAELWMPYVFTPKHRVRAGRYMMAIARLKEGISLTQAQAEMDTIASHLVSEYPAFNTGWGVNLVPLHEQVSGQVRPALLVLLGAVGFVLLIACANVANLMLSRASARQREISIRIALGAGRWRIARQILTETIVLAAIGGVLGSLLAFWGVRALLAVAPKDLMDTASVGIDIRVLAFTSAISVLAGLIFGIAPALQSVRAGITEALKEGGRGATSGGLSHQLRNAFVVAELGLAIVLLAGSGLLIRSFARLQSVDAGFNPQNLLTLKLSLPFRKYREDKKTLVFFQEMLDRVKGLPGVQDASAISFLPFRGPGSATDFTIVGQPEPPAGERPVTDVRVIAPDYFKTMGIPVRSGRLFTPREATEMSGVVIINETMARAYFPSEDPIGKKVIIDMKDTNTPSEIVGIVGDVKHEGLDTTPRSMVYWPHPELAMSFMTLVVRTAADPKAMASAIRQEALSMDRDQPISEVATMEQLMSDSVARARFNTLLLGIFAGIALLLASVGIYGVMSYAVTQRTHELGIRMALGAARGDVIRMVALQGARLALTGALVGLVAAFALTRLLSTLLFGITAKDPATFVGVAVLLGVVALVACYIPARRATRVDPLIALRYEG